MSKTTLKYGVECIKNPMEYTFTFGCPLLRPNLTDIIKKNLLYELLFQLNKDSIKEMCIEPLKETQEDRVRLVLSMNYLDDGDENERVLPLINKTTFVTPERTEIIGKYDEEIIHCTVDVDYLPIKLSMFHMTLETIGGEFRCTFVIRLTEKMNTLKENAFGLIIQKILGRLKNYASVL
jgi:hypothetical protein